MTSTPADAESTPTTSSSAESDETVTENIPDGSGTDASSGDDEQDTTSGGAPEDPEK